MGEDSPHSRLLTPEAAEAIISASGLLLLSRKRRGLERAIEKAMLNFLLSREVAQTSLVPSRDAKRARAAASALDKALGLLEERPGLPAGDLMAWAGFEADEVEGRAGGRPSGFERAANAVEQIGWLRDQIQKWAVRTQNSPRTRSGRIPIADARHEAVWALAPAYQRAFGRPMAASRGGPAARFLRAFFAVCGDRPHATTLVTLLRDVRRTDV